MKTTRTIFGKSGGLRGKITSGLVALSLAVGMVAATPTPAHAATSVRGCFSYGGGYGQVSALWDTPVELMAYHPDGYFFVIGRSRLSSTGCSFFSLTGSYTGVFLVMRVEARMNGGVYRGVSPDFAYPGYGHYDLGTGQVTFSYY